MAIALKQIEDCNRLTTAGGTPLMLAQASNAA